jgi:hypothetical protein
MTILSTVEVGRVGFSSQGSQPPTSPEITLADIHSQFESVGAMGRFPADPGTQLREKRASSMYTYGNSQGWLIRATGCYLMQRKTPTSRSIGNKAVLLAISGRVELNPLVPEGWRVSERFAV